MLAGPTVPLHRDVPWVKVPTVYWEVSSPRVITLEYLPGERCSGVQGLNSCSAGCG